MTNLNPIFDAMNNIDDSIITNAEKTNKKPILLRIGIIAAAAAMLVLGVGFAAKVTGVFGTGKDTFTLNGNDLTIQFNTKYHEITIPEEFKIRYEGVDFDCYYPENMKPSELFAKFGVSPLLNDNFWEKTDSLSVEMLSWQIEFGYVLQDKKLGTEVYIRAKYITDENMLSIAGSTEDKDIYPEVVTLNDGSSCIVTSNMATFAYDGVYYRISVYGEEKSHDVTKQVLADLGVL